VRPNGFGFGRSRRGVQGLSGIAFVQAHETDSQTTLLMDDGTKPASGPVWRKWLSLENGWTPI
jgi:hypothetical protein